MKNHRKIRGCLIGIGQYSEGLTTVNNYAQVLLRNTIFKQNYAANNFKHNMKLKKSWCLMVFYVISIHLGPAVSQRASLVDRLKALDKGIRQGLQRQKSEPSLPSVTATDSNVENASLAIEKAKPDEENQHPKSAISRMQLDSATDMQVANEEEDPIKVFNRHQFGIKPEDNDGASDVVRQLTESEQEGEEGAQTGLVTSKEGNLEVDEGTGERKRPLIKPTKYHYYPHNQHLYLLPECATQQVCNAVYTRFNFTQPLCACADRFQGPCSASIGRNDLHTIEVGLRKGAKADKAKAKRSFKSPTLVKTCEETRLIRDCRAPQDWALLALQNVRTGKSQYLVICRCEQGDLDGPMSHDQPAYARVPGIRVYGMMCNSGNGTISRNQHARSERSSESAMPQFPWEKVVEFSTSLDWN